VSSNSGDVLPAHALVVGVSFGFLLLGLTPIVLRELVRYVGDQDDDPRPKVPEIPKRGSSSAHGRLVIGRSRLRVH
jgi:hypothetical protein